MKIRPHSIVVVVAVVCFATGLQMPASAAEQAVVVVQTPAGAGERGLYYGLDGGVNFAHDIDGDFNSVGGDGEFDVGFRFDAIVGYNLNKFLGFELESGFLYNNFDTITVGGTPDDPGDSWLGRIPILANAIFRLENDTKWIPYAGVGLGAALSILEGDEANANDTDFVMAWQAQLGVRYAIDESTTLGVGYKYFGTASQEYEIEGTNIELDPSHNHAFVLNFTISF